MLILKKDISIQTSMAKIQRVAHSRAFRALRPSVLVYKETFNFGNSNVSPYSTYFFPCSARVVTSLASLVIVIWSDDSLGYGCMLTILHSDTGKLILVCIDIAD